MATSLVTARPRRAVRLFAEDPELLRAAPPRVRDHLKGSFFADTAYLEHGFWRPDLDLQDEAAGLLIVAGVLAREVTIAGARNVELLGPGDVLTQIDEYGLTVARQTVFEVVIPTELAILDDRFVQLISRVPQLLPEVMKRAARRAHCLSAHFALSRVRPMSKRLHLFLWQLADRWGRRIGDEVVIPLPLTHELLSRAVGGDRAAISRAITELRNADLVERGPDRSWILRGVPAEVGLSFV